MVTGALPTLVITHGAWHSPKHFHKLVPKLESYGYKCICPKLPAVGTGPPTTSLQPDIDTIRNIVQEACDRSEDVIVIPHSWSGIPAGTALEGLSKPEREEHGLPGGVVKLVYMASFMVPVGTSLWELCGGVSPAFWIWQGENNETILPDDPQGHFFTDLPREEADHYAAMLEPLSSASVFGKTTSAAFMHIPTLYIECAKDEALTVQKLMVDMAHKAGAADLQTVTVDSAHSPFLSKVDETVEIIRRAAGESF